MLFRSLNKEEDTGNTAYDGMDCSLVSFDLKNLRLSLAMSMNPVLVVRQGQVIGYLGSSGLSTGPHLHYEVLVKGEFKDPMAIKLPRNKELNNSEIALFKQQQDIINDIMSKAPGAVRVANKPAQP